MASCLFSLPDSSVSSWNLVFSYDGCQEEGSCMFLKKGGYQERGMKKERGMGGGDGNIFLQYGCKMLESTLELVGILHILALVIQFSCIHFFFISCFFSLDLAGRNISENPTYSTFT